MNKKNKIKYLVFLLSIFSFANVISLPTEPKVEYGQVKFDSTIGKALNITASDKAIINWKDFSIKADEIAKFLQPSKQSTVLNRVIGDDVSELLGSLKANGHVFLLNPNGIIFGENALIDTNGLTASTFDVLNEDFINSQEILFKGNSNKTIINYGKINAWDGDVNLIGRVIENFGEINGQDVSIAAGFEVLLKPTSDEKIIIRPSCKKEVSQDNVCINNKGKISAIKAKLLADGNPFSLAINHKGEIDAVGIEERNGQVYLIAEEGATRISGKISAKNIKETGGEVHLLGKNGVSLAEKAEIDVSADFGGGIVLIGGDKGGTNPKIQNAEDVYIAENAIVKADALLEGNGGKIIVWSDEDTEIAGILSAQGGAKSGDGGFIETSSRGSFAITSLKDSSLIKTNAPNGKVGTWLIDPCDITISAAVSNPLYVGNPNFPDYYPPGAAATLNNVDLQNGLLNNNVIVNATLGVGGAGDITINAPILWNAVPAGGTTLTLIASNIIYVNDLVTAQNATALDTTDVLDLQAQSVLIGAPFGFIPGSHLNPVGLQTTSGSVRIQAPISLEIYGGNSPGANSQALVDAGTGGDGSVIVNTGDVVLRGGTGIVSPVLIRTGVGIGSVTINSTGDLTMVGGTSIALTDATIESQSGPINITMTGNNKNTYIRAGSSNSSDVVIVTFGGDDINFTMNGTNGNCTIIGGSGGNTTAGIVTENGGDITCSITGDYILTGASASNWGHAIIWSSTLSGIGDVNLAGRNLTLQGGTATAAADNDAAIVARQGNININMSGDVLLRGSDVANNETARIYTMTSGNISINANNMDLISGSALNAPVTIITPIGDISITTTGYLSLLGNATNTTNIETQGSNMLIRSGTDIIIGPFSTVVNSGIGDLTFVADNLFPTAPDFGTGRFDLDVTSTVSTTNGNLRVFTALQELNVINGTLNGAIYTPGALFVDTALERWNTYYPDTFGGVPFTLFFKDTVDEVITYDLKGFVIVPEILRDLHPYDEYLNWSLRFSVQHRLSKTKNLTSEEKYFFIRRRNKKDGNVYIQSPLKAI